MPASGAPIQSTSKHSTPDPDDPAPVLTIDEGSFSAAESEASSRRESVSSDSRPPVLAPEDRDRSKNLEIRRLSATEDGNKILNDAWESPEKDEEKTAKKKTPLQMVENIVSNIELLPKEGATSSDASDTSAVAGPSTLAPTTLKGNKPGKTNKNVLLPPLTHSPPAWTQGGRLATAANTTQPMVGSQSQQPLLLPRDPNHNQSLPQPIQPAPTASATAATGTPTPPVMQLVNTINGPVLMQAVPTNIVQVPSPAQPAQHKGVRPILKKRKKKPTPLAPAPPQRAILSPQTATATATAPRSSVVPILMSPTVAQSGSQILAIGPQQQAQPQLLPQSANFVQVPAAGSGQQVLLANGTLVTIPPAVQATGVVLNQMPDGTFVQVQNAAANSAGGPGPQQAAMMVQPTAVIQGGQQFITAGGQIFVNPAAGGTTAAPVAGQILSSPQGGGTLYMTPQGLVQATAVSAATAAPHPQPQQQQQADGSIVVVSSPQQLFVQTTSPSIQVMSGQQVRMSPMQQQQSSEALQQSPRVPRHPPVLKRQDNVPAKDFSNQGDEEDDDEVQEVKDTQSSSDSGDDDDEEEEEEEEDEAEEDDDDEEVQELTGEEKQVKLTLQTSPRNRSASSSSTAPPQLSSPSPSTSRGRSGGGSRPPPQKSKVSPQAALSSTPLSSPDSAKSSPRTPFIQSNQVDSSGLKATPPYSGSEFDTTPTTSTSQRKGDLPVEAATVVSTSQHAVSEDDDDDDDDVDTGLNTSGRGSRAGRSLDDSGSSGGRGARASPASNTSGSGGKKRRKRNADQILKEEGILSDERKRN